MNKYNSPKNTWFVDYTMCLLENDDILMDSEMTLAKLRASAGDCFQVKIDEDRIIFEKVEQRG